MDKYIDREAFLAAKRKVYCEDCDSRKNSKGKMVYDIGDVPCRACGVGDVLDDVEDFPAADVRPVVNAHWVVTTNREDCRCSACGELISNEEQFAFSYCPNCGARMDGEDNV